LDDKEEAQGKMNLGNFYEEILIEKDEG